jgi:hypothetical protein
MSSRHLGCPGCRIRVRASAPEVDLLEGSCPICGATLRPVLSASGLMGFRLFDLDAFSEQESSGTPPTSRQPVDLEVRSEAAWARDGFAADRWSDEGSSVSGEPVAERPAGTLVAVGEPPAPSQLVDQEPVHPRQWGHGRSVFGGGRRGAYMAHDDMRLDDRSVRH